MTKKKIFLSSPHMSDQGYEQQFIKEAFATNWIAPIGNNIDIFEREVASLVGVKSSVALASGTSAIHLALKAAGVKEGDVVICQSLTFSASANPIIYEKAIPVFVDSDYETWNMDPEKLEEALKKHPNAKAVIVVHLYGISANIKKIVDICHNYKVPLIEDAAESLGSLYDNKYTGTFGDYGIFSFNGNKIITTSGGGMLISNNEERINKAKFWATQSRDEARHYQHSELGYNYRMSNVVAGIGRGQLQVLQERITKKRYIFAYYQKAFKDIKEIKMMPQNNHEYSNCWLTSILIDDTSKVKNIDVILALEKDNIESRPIWKPLHLQPFFNGYEYFGVNVCEDIFSRGLCLPSDTKMTDEDLERVVSIVRKLFL